MSYIRTYLRTCAATIKVEWLRLAATILIELSCSHQNSLLRLAEPGWSIGCLIQQEFGQHFPNVGNIYPMRYVLIYFCIFVFVFACMRPHNIISDIPVPLTKSFSKIYHVYRFSGFWRFWAEMSFEEERGRGGKFLLYHVPRSTENNSSRGYISHTALCACVPQLKGKAIILFIFLHFSGPCGRIS